MDRLVYDSGACRARPLELLEAGGKYSLVAISRNKSRIDFSSQSSGQPVKVFPLLPRAI
jgi:hypothetical protein